MDSQLDRQAFTEPPTRRACLVDGCPCKDARIISTRRVAFYSEWARQHEETADRQIEPDPEWADLFRPWRGRSRRPPSSATPSANSVAGTEP